MEMGVLNCCHFHALCSIAKHWLWAPGPVTPAIAWAGWVCPFSPAMWVTSFQEQAPRSKFLWENANLAA